MNSKEAKTLASSNGTFSGADVVAHLIFPGKPAIKLGQVTTITYSTYRETTPVRTIGRINAKGFSKGQRTIAGTIIFTVFEKHVINQLKEEIDYIKYIKKLKPCELPPFDIMLSFGNEYGSSAKLFIYGVEVVDEGKIFSVEDMFTENTWSYMARDIDLMDDIDAEQNAPLLSLGEKDSAGKFKVDDLVMDDDYIKMQDELKKLKDHQQQAIEDARKQNQEYIANIDSFNKETIYPSIGGNPVWEDIPVDPEKSECVDPSIKNSTTPQKRPVLAKNQTAIYVEAIFNMAAVYRENDMAELLLPKLPLRVNFKCSHGGKRTWTYYFIRAGITKFNISKNATVKMILIGDDLTTHKPEFPEITITAPKEVAFKTGTKFELSTADVVPYGNFGTTSAAPIRFVYNEKGGKEDQANEKLKNMKIHVEFRPISSAIKRLPGRGGGENTQYMFRNATSMYFRHIGKNIIGLGGGRDPKDYYDKDGSFFTPLNAWASQRQIADTLVKARGYENIDPKPFYDYAIPRLMPGFLASFTITDLAGKPVSPDLSKLKLRCKYKVYVVARNANDVPTTYIIDGINKNNNIATKLSVKENSAWLKLSDPKYYKLSDLKSGKAIEPYDPQLEFVFLNKDYKNPNGLAKAIYRAVHEQSRDLGVDSKHFTTNKINQENIDDFMGPKSLDKDGNKYCKCRFKYSKMTFEAYDFVIVNEYGAELQTTTNFQTLRFPVADLTDEIVDILKPLVNKK